MYTVKKPKRPLMPNPTDTYASYLLRLRRVQSDTGRTWLASLQSTATGGEQWFVDVNALVEFLHSEFGDRAQASKTDGPVGQ
jgi:hypothetical protein